MPVTCDLIALYISVCMEFLCTLLYVKGVRPRHLTCGKGGELKRINNELGVFDLGRLLVVRVGNLKQLASS